MRAPVKRLPADERRAVTVRAVVDLAAEQNPSDITTAAIAESMGLTQGALFRSFPTKDAVWRAVMEWVAERLLARIDRAADGVESPLAAMQAIFMSHVEFVEEHPGVPRIIFGELQGANATPAKLISRCAHRCWPVRSTSKSAWRRCAACGRYTGFDQTPLRQTAQMRLRRGREFFVKGRQRRFEFGREP